MVKEILREASKMKEKNEPLYILIWNHNIIAVLKNQSEFNNYEFSSLKDEDARILQIYFDGTENYLFAFYPSLFEIQSGMPKKAIDKIYISANVTLLGETIMTRFIERNTSCKRRGSRFVLNKVKNKINVVDRYSGEIVSDFSTKAEANKFLKACNNNFGISM